MNDFHTPDPSFKFRPDYEWPKEGSERNCPRCDSSMQLNEDNPAYFGKPWWCPKCQFQFSEEDLTKGVNCPNNGTARKAP